MDRLMFDQQPTVEFPEWMHALGFVDHSWRNDAAAYTRRGDLAAWVAEAEAREREFPEGDRFYCWVGVNADDPTNCDAPGCTLIYKGEDEAAFRRAVEEFIAWTESR
jgi:hypothetical protein